MSIVFRFTCILLLTLFSKEAFSGEVSQATARLIKGQFFTYGAISSEGALWSWRQRYSNATQELAKMKDATVPVWLYSDKVIRVSMRGTREIVIKGDNSLWSLKYTAKPDGSGSYSYTLDSNPQIILNNVVAAEFSDSEYENFILALALNGTLWGWGDNHHWQLGAPLPSARWSTEVAYPKPLFADVIAFNAGNNITLIVNKKNQLWGMGQNGQLEDAEDEHQYSLLNLPTGKVGNNIEEPKLLMKNILTVGSNWYAVFAVKTDNSLWVWGDNLDLGISDTLPKKYIPPTKIAESIKDVRGGGSGGFAFRDTDNGLWVRGKYLLEYYPRCFDKSQKKGGAYFFMDDIVDYAVSDSAIMVVKNDGTIWGCGDPKYLGLADHDLSTSRPFQITLPSVPPDAKSFFDSVHETVPKE